MILETIRNKLEQVPFEPFVVRAGSGKAYRVADPALVVLMKSKICIAEPRSDRAATVPYLHITAVEEASNGPPAPARPPQAPALRLTALPGQ